MHARIENGLVVEYPIANLAQEAAHLRGLQVHQHALTHQQNRFMVVVQTQALPPARLGDV